MACPPVDVELLLVPDCSNAVAARDLLRSALREAGLSDTPIRISVIESLRAAESRGFTGSPTILINGVDPFAQPGRPCALACRVYSGSSDAPGASGSGGLPPAEYLSAALGAAVGTPLRRRDEPQRRAPLRSDGLPRPARVARLDRW